MSFSLKDLRSKGIYLSVKDKRDVEVQFNYMIYAYNTPRHPFHDGHDIYHDITDDKGKYLSLLYDEYYHPGPGDYYDQPEDEKEDDLLEGVQCLLKVARGDSRGHTTIRKFLVAMWNDRPFLMSDLVYLDPANYNNARWVIAYLFENNFRWPDDFKYADDLRDLCEFDNAKEAI